MKKLTWKNTLNAGNYKMYRLEGLTDTFATINYKGCNYWEVRVGKKDGMTSQKKAVIVSLKAAKSWAESNLASI